MPEQTALIVPVPEAEPVVGAHRAVLDRSAAWGVPAHITVLYPFLPPRQVDDQVLAALGDIFAGHPAYEIVLLRVAWFGTDVLSLAAAPDEPFRQLTAAVWARFPQAPPYGGEFADVVPHLTVGERAPSLPAVAAEVAGQLPITAVARSVRLIQGASGLVRWRTVAEFPLGAAPR